MAVRVASVGAVTSVDHINATSGRIASVLLVFERLHWREVQANLAERARQVAPVSASAADISPEGDAFFRFGRTSTARRSGLWAVDGDVATVQWMTIVPAMPG